MLRVTCDTNVLISASIVQGKQYEILRIAKMGEIKLILSPDIIEEFKEVISRPRFSFSQEQVANAVQQILDLAEIVIPQEKLDIIIEDEEDNKVLECALEGKVQYIISGDSHLLSLKSYENIEIVNATSFLDIFNKIG